MKMNKSDKNGKQAKGGFGRITANKKTLGYGIAALLMCAVVVVGVLASFASSSNESLPKAHVPIISTADEIIETTPEATQAASPVITPATLPEIRDIFTLQSPYNITVVILFDSEQPNIQLVSPNGDFVDMQNIRYRLGYNFMQFFLPSAAIGTWQMAYDPLTNTEISAHYSVYMEHIFIRNFEADVFWSENEHIPVTFEVSADHDGEVNYEIHAIFTASDNSVAEEILLAKGYGQLNEVLSLNLVTDEIQDGGGFMLRLTAYVQHGQAAVRDTAWFDLRISPIFDQ